MTAAKKAAAKPDQADAPKAEKAAKTPDLGSAAERRANYVAALEQERDMCDRVGKSDRVKAIDAELKRVQSVKDRSDAGPSDEA